jgi:hypothetical protein
MSRRSWRILTQKNKKKNTKERPFKELRWAPKYKGRTPGSKQANTTA